MGPAVSVVVATRNRRDSLVGTLGRLVALPETPRIIVVDNASDDGTADAVSELYPDVDLIRLRSNLGAAARNLGVERAGTDFVAFSDDDSWWEPGSLRRARAFLRSHPGVGLAAARIVVAPTGNIDPVSHRMRESPLDAGGLPAPRVLGFLACAAVTRRDAFLDAGGFWPPLRVGAEEKLLAIDLEMAGWALVYLDDVVAYHAPAGRDSDRRRRTLARNEVWISWLRRPVGSAVRRTAALAGRGISDGAVAAGVKEAMSGLPAVLRRRRVVSARLERELRSIGA